MQDHGRRHIDKEVKDENIKFIWMRYRSNTVVKK